MRTLEPDLLIHQTEEKTCISNASASSCHYFLNNKNYIKILWALLKGLLNAKRLEIQVVAERI